MTMISREQFAEHVADAYEHLHDLVYLRTHPLGEILLPESASNSRKRARELHTLLSNLIDELDPGPQAATFSSEWRRHRYLVLRYIKGLSHQGIADQFQVGLRQYYRQRKAIISEIADMLWIQGMEDREPSRFGIPQSAAARDPLELLRLEGARLAQVERYAQIHQVIDGVLAILQEHLHQRRIEVKLDLPAVPQAASVSQDLLRQILLSSLTYLSGPVRQATLGVSASVTGPTMVIRLWIEPVHPAPLPGRGELGEHLDELMELAYVGHCQVEPLTRDGGIFGFELLVPVAQRTVLVVDDNMDVIQLFRGYLSLHGYHVVATQQAQEALPLARKLKPYAITLDLMMPEHDGWESLQILVNDPETGDIPVIICTVLKQKELALSLGATAYLEKPVTELALASTLEALAAR